MTSVTDMLRSTGGTTESPFTGQSPSTFADRLSPRTFWNQLKGVLEGGAGKGNSGKTATAGVDPVAAEKTAKVEKAAGDLVSNALILPMLKQLRRSPWGENTLFPRGIGEKAFGPQFDMQVSDRIAHSPRLGIKAAVAKRLMQHNGLPDAKLTNTGTFDIHG